MIQIARHKRHHRFAGLGMYVLGNVVPKCRVRGSRESWRWRASLDLFGVGDARFVVATGGIC